MSDSAPRPQRAARSAARLAAVQALYQMDVGGTDAETVVEEFVQHRFGAELEDAPFPEAEEELFAAIVRGVVADQTQIDRTIARCLAEGWTLERIDSILRAILRAGAFELMHKSDVPARVAISEYLDLTHAFFAGPEPSFVNGVLDKLAHRLRDTV